MEELTDEQVEKIKQELMSQLDNFPEDKRGQIREQIESMSNEQVAEFIEQNQLSHLEPGRCVFCSIVSGQVDSVKIAEDEGDIAILEINPLTKGHTLIISKKHEDKPSRDFAAKTGDLLLEKLKAKDVKVEETEVMGHSIINLVPVYGDIDLKKTRRKKASKGELEELQKEITAPSEKKVEPPVPTIVKKEFIPKLKPRIP